MFNWSELGLLPKGHGSAVQHFNKAEGAKNRRALRRGRAGLGHPHIWATATSGQPHQTTHVALTGHVVCVSSASLGPAKLRLTGFLLS